MILARRQERSLDATVYSGTFPNGLSVIFLPRPGTIRKVALLGVDFGSVDVEAAPAAGGDPIRFPAGTAHFLEHMMFMKHDGDLAMAFAGIGATSNAATDYTSTVYSCAASGRFEEALGLLARLVLEMHVDEAEVARERGVIGQELKMYLDTPDVKLYQGLVESLYHAHPLRVDPGGTLESIARIDGATLARAHAGFYVPGKLRLTVAGDLDPADLFRMVRTFLVDPHPARVAARAIMPQEPAEVRAARFETVAPASCPRALLGIKDPRPPRPGPGAFLSDLTTSIVHELAFGRGSDLYSRLYREGVLDDSFSASFSSHPTFSFSTIGGDTDDPERFWDRLAAGIRSVRKRGLRRRDFERIKRKVLGRLLQRLDDAEGAAWLAWTYAAVGVELLDFPKLIRRATLAACRERLDEHLDLDAGRTAFAVVRPERE